MHKVFEYGVIKILSGEERLIDQLFARTRYWNSLVEVERVYQEGKEEALLQASESMAEAQLVVDAAEQGLVNALATQADARKAARSKRLSSEYAEAVSLARAARREAYATFRQVRKDAFGSEDVQARLHELREQRTAAVRAARTATDLYWGTYLDVENNYRAQRVKKGALLRFHRAVPEGAVSVWLLDGGIPTSRIWGDSSMIQVDPVSEGAWLSPIRGERRRLSRTTARLRVGTTDRTADYVEVQMVMHRPLPDDGIIRHASVVRRRIGTHYRHTLTITVETADNGAVAHGGPVAAIDVGWRLFQDRLRVAYMVDDRGNREEISLPRFLLDELHKTEHIQSIRDINFNDAKAVFLVQIPQLDKPAWWVEATATLPQWRSAGRLAGLVLRWRHNRFPGDVEAYDALETWRKRDKHLLEYQANLRDQLLRQRRERYRVWAVGIARKYGTVVLEDFVLPSLDKDEQHEAARWLQRVAAIGELRVILGQTCTREGVVVTKAPAEYTTQRCHVCEHVNDFDAAANLSHRCDGCGAEWDQDYNAARNLLLWHERQGRSQAVAVPS